MLDEERLVPTNCMRACTAVVTEISYNNGGEQYRAQIEFISHADWARELTTLFNVRDAKLLRHIYIIREAVLRRICFSHVRTLPLVFVSPFVNS